MGNILERLSQLATVFVSLSAVVIAGIVVRDRIRLEKRGYDDVEVDDWVQYAAVGHQSGPRDAKVTVVEFGDYQCPACRGFAPILDSILQKYGDRVSFVYRHFPLESHDRAYPAARAAECAHEQGRFWDFHRKLYATRSWVNGSFIDLAEEVGILDIPSFENCIGSLEPVEEIERDIQAARAIGARGTPTILINETMLTGGRDFTAMSQLIDSKGSGPY
jgi:protein-disulfide isomerase